MILFKYLTLEYQAGSFGTTGHSAAIKERQAIQSLTVDKHHRLKKRSINKSVARIN
jgi:hypothetical protein